MKKYCDYYYSVKKDKDGRFSYKIFGDYWGEVLETETGFDTRYEAEEAAREAISYHYV